MATEVLMPPLGQTVDAVTLVRWYKQEGEPVQQGEKLFVIETDKATLDIEAPASGILRDVRAGPGDTVKVLTPIAVIAAPDERPAPAPAARPPAQPAPPAAAETHITPSPARPPQRERIFISPRARRLAEQYRVPLSALHPTGPEGAIVERDVRAYLEKRPPAVVSPAAIPIVPSAGAPAPVTLIAQVDVTELGHVQEQLRQAGVETALRDWVLFVAGRALRRFPAMNAALVEGAIQPWAEIHIRLIAEAASGEAVVALRHADQKTPLQIADEAGDLLEKARAGALGPEEAEGTTFTVVDMSMFPIDAFTPLLPASHCAALGIGRTTERPAAVQNRLEIRSTLWLSLAFDHRLVDGAPAAQFLSFIAHALENPHLLIGFA